MSFLPPEALAHLRGVFVEEAEQSLREAQAHCANWAPGTEAPHRIRAVLHGLKGAAGSVELPALADAIHQFEELFVQGSGEGHAPKPQHVTDLLRGLRDLLPHARSPEGLPASALSEFLSRLGESAGAPPQATARPTGPARPAATPAAPAHALVEHTTVQTDALVQAVALATDLKRALAELRVDPGAPEALQRATVGAEELETLLERLRQSPGAEALEGLDAEGQALAGRLGKAVRMTLSGAEVRCERQVLQKARGLLRHLLRNAVDHGLETPSERTAAGKPAQARLDIALGVDGGQLQVQVQDDGRGFDIAKIRARLGEGMDEGELSALDDEAALLRFATQGGSTRDEASDVSGRGVGLSAVARAAREAKGTFSIQTRAGLGTTITFTLPVEVWVAEVLTFTVEGTALALPTHAVACAARHRDDDEALQTPVGEVVSIAGITARKVDLAAALGLGEAARRPFVVMLQHEERVLALDVDELGAVHRVVPRTSPPVVRPDALVTGLVMLPEFGAVQVLHPGRLLERAALAPAAPAPAARAPSARTPWAKAAAAPARPKTSGLRVLLVEDSAATREVYRLLLESDGHQVTTAVNGAEGLRAALLAPPDLILSDVDMPVQDGFAMTRALRSHPTVARTPVVLLTSRDDANSRAEGAASGADAYLVKSQFTPAALRGTLARLGLADRT